ncbi:MAG TPA: UDP-N-acetylmuramoyl-L-alanyl-D-glutamate--2,6-diaminopimelate ligase, partial [Kofleriaceae bacterium]|nr:UDP-N-acetylmuramoyl-L-alanyl-D-glutamate--2,6-diaminopimelate ligase [Kofleriaceae bacterium]
DSRTVQPGDVFVAIKGMRSDGHAFVPSVVQQGAIAVVVERELDVKVPQIVVPSTSRALGPLVARSLGNPAAGMTLIGITGTNGKTTTTYLVESILLAAGHKPGVIGTVEVRWPGGSESASYTTPTPQLLHGAFAKMREAGCTHVVMEVTSSALALDRVVGLTFAVGGFSNLTQDHLDVHGTMEAYRAAKHRLFAEHLKGGTAVVNVDDPEGEGMAGAADPRHTSTLRVSVEGRLSDIRVTFQESTVKGIHASIATPTGAVPIEAKPLIGQYNVANLALAVGIAEALKIPHDAIAAGIAELKGVPGRVERVVNGADLDILVDYAHTPDALRNVLTALRPLTRRRLICVFGCGGDRDPTKRPKMGAAVAELADLAVVTSDNPRTEDPRKILDQILPAVPKPFFVDVDRRAAIRAAIAEATPGDVVVIAGKGHEDYQILGTTKIHFDDREEAAAAAAEREQRLVAGLARDAGGELLGDGNVNCDRVVIDSRVVAPGALYVAIRGEQHDGHRFCLDAVKAGATAVMVDKEGKRWAPAAAPDLLAPELRSLRNAAIVVDDTRLALGKIARSHRRAWASDTRKLVAITGSAGKTTTKELTRCALAMAGTTHAAEGSLNNETGLPLTLLGLRLFHQYGVVEMGMRGLGQIEYLTKIAEPDVAVVVNAGSAHIELLGSTDAIAQAKSEIWLGLRPGGTVVLPAGDQRLEYWARQHQPTARHVTFGDGDADVRLIEYKPTDAGAICQLDVFGDKHELKLQLVGKHAAIDACAALAAAHAAGASSAQALAGLSRALPVSMRGEVIELGGRKVIVDCYNANPASMTAALHSLAERAHGLPAIAVLGDMLELGDHAPAAHKEIGELANKLGIGVVGIGEMAKYIVDAAGKDAELSPSHAAAAERALARTESAGGWILLKASRGMKLERVLEVMKEQTP